MKDEAMLALAKEFAKNLKTEADLNNFSKALASFIITIKPFKSNTHFINNTFIF